jgi:transcriptional regulator with XRE-family HTH domain
MTLARILDAERQRQSLTVNELARRADASLGRVHGVLTGKTPDPRFATVRAILKGLGRSLTWLDRQLGAVHNSAADR